MINTAVIYSRDSCLRQIVQQLLKRDPEVSFTACSGMGELKPLQANHTLHVIILGYDADGALIKRLRDHYWNIGLIALLEHNQGVFHRIACLELGADMALSAEAPLAELLACIKTVSRRVSYADIPPHTSEWTLKRQDHSLVAPDGSEAKLSAFEYLFMRQVAAAFPEPVSRQELAAALGYEYLTFDERRLEAMVGRLRRKLPTPAPDAASPLRCARMRGYFFAEPLAFDEAVA